MQPKIQVRKERLLQRSRQAGFSGKEAHGCAVGAGLTPESRAARASTQCVHSGQAVKGEGGTLLSLSFGSVLMALFLSLSGP